MPQVELIVHGVAVRGEAAGESFGVVEAVGQGAGDHRLYAVQRLGDMFEKARVFGGVDRPSYASGGQARYLSGVVREYRFAFGQEAGDDGRRQRPKP